MATNNPYAPRSLTKAVLRELANAPAPEKPRELLDTKKGLIVRHQPSGYLGVYALLGRGKRERLANARDVLDPDNPLTWGTVLQQAKVVQGEAAGGRDFKAERAGKRAVPTLKSYLDDTYGPWVRQNRRSGAETLTRLRKCFEDKLGRLKLDEITLDRLERWRSSRRKKGVTPETINRDLTALHAALARAVKLKMIAANPIAGIERAEVDRNKRVVRALTADEKACVIEKLIERDDRKRKQRASANEWRAKRGKDLLPPIGRFADLLTPAVILSLETGARRGELFSLAWPNVDLGEKVIRVRGKTYQSRDIPLSDVAFKTLRDWWLQRGQPKSGYVFAMHDERVGNLKRSYHAVLEAAEVERLNGRGERVNWHSLRHTFGTLLGAAGVDGPTLMKLMGHANLATTQRYLHTDAKRMREAVELARRV